MSADPNFSQKQPWRFWKRGPGVGNTLRGQAISVRHVRRATPVTPPPDERMSRMREANERLVVAAVRAQALTEKAETASHLKDEFIATVSHEIRTPLNAVLGWARILQSKKLASADAERAIAAIGRSAAALAHMIDDLLDTSRVLNGGIRLDLRPVDLAAVAQEAIDTVRPLAEARKVHLSLEAASGSCMLNGDAQRLEQAIWNLLSNAIKFTPEGGRVDVFITSVPPHTELRVVDTGVGISPTFLPHVFDRFRQAENATTQRQTGLGLGLWIARHLVELHRGTVQAASAGPGQGSTFTVRLPITPERQTPSRSY